MFSKTTMKNPKITPSFTEQKSYLSVLSPFDEESRYTERFEIQSIVGKEKLCGNFTYDLEISTRERITESEFDQLVGNPLTVCFSFRDSSGKFRQRYINGLVYRLREKGMSRFPLAPQIWRYKVEISSWLKQLQAAKDCRIFQKQSNTALSIISDLLIELGFPAFKNETRIPYPKREYVTMYNESYFDFIVRLLQDEGILWRFEHEKGKHTLVFCDDSTMLPELSSTQWANGDDFQYFCKKETHVPVEAVQTTSFDSQNPPVRVVNKPDSLSGTQLRHFEYPGNFIDRSEGESKMDRLQTALTDEKILYTSASSIRALEAGKRFTLNLPTLPDLHQMSFLIRELSVNATEDSYSNEFTAMPSKNRFYYEFCDRCSKPVIHGNQTAMVVGEKNAANIHTNKLGSIMVRFHWDHHSPPNTGSAFVRNAMPAAGNHRGFIFNPNIGDEVVVKFEDGDPDRPLIMGRVYSSVQRAPVSPGQKPDQSIIQPKDGTNANRILFDDKTGSENLEFRAKKDMNIKVGRNLTINADRNWNVNCKNLDVTATGDFDSGNVISMAGLGIHTEAGKKISNMTRLAATEIAGSVSDNKAGCNTVNLTLGLMNTTSGGATVSKSPMIFNTATGDIILSGQEKVKNSGMMVVNTGSDLIDNAAPGKIEQEAKLAILSSTKNETNKIGDESKTKAMMVKNQGDMVINK